MSEKEELRKRFIKIRNDLLGKDSKSLIVFNKIIEDKDFKNAKRVALYKSLKSEVNTDYLIDYLLNNKKEVLLPRVVFDDIVFLKYSKGDILEKSKFGVMEPVYNIANLFEKNSIDLIIVPGVSFTSDGNRLGFGKGYYDRYLNGCNIKTIGICFKEQICDYIPVDKNDYKVDKVITD